MGDKGNTGDALYFMSYQAELRTLQQAFDLIKQNRDVIVYNQKDTIVEPYEFSVIINGELFNFKRTANDFNFVQLEAENYFYVPPRVFFQKLNVHSSCKVFKMEFQYLYKWKRRTGMCNIPPN